MPTTEATQDNPTLSIEMLADLVADQQTRIGRLERATAQLGAALFSAGLTNSIRAAAGRDLEELMAAAHGADHAAQLLHGGVRRNEVGLPLGPVRPAGDVGLAAQSGE